MKRNSLPESLELLLDTMCNTFGGVMFIAISMVITLIICQQQLTPEKQFEAEKKRLEACKRENQSLKARYEHEKKRLEQMKKLAHTNEHDRDSELAETVVRLGQNVRELKRQRDTLNSEIKITEAQTERLERKNSRLERENLRKQAELKKRGAELEAKNRLLVDELAALRAALQNTPVKQINFARNERTSRAPYEIIIKDNRLFCAGAPPLRSSERVTIRREGRTICLSPAQGPALSSIDADNFFGNCPGFLPDAHFLRIQVSDDSFAAFVKFRRMLRALGCRWPWFSSADAIIRGALRIPRRTA